ncbi:DUF4435 domain-containing protein [Massilia sp. LMS1-1-1.1]
MKTGKLRKDLPHVILDFNKKYGNPMRPVLAVVEGKDEDYYRPRLSGLTRGCEINFIDANGKDNVIDLHEHLKISCDAYDVDRYVLFADRDYDAIRTDARLYVTNRHSVENFYTCPESFKNLIANKFNLNLEGREDELRIVVDRYISWVSYVSKETLQFSAWLFWQLTEAPKVDGKPPRLNLNGLNLSTLFEIKFDDKSEISIVKKFDINKSKDIFPYSAENNFQRIFEIMSEIDGQDFFFYFRGKFILEMYMVILENLKIDSRREKPNIFRGKCKTSLTWSSQILAELSSFAETPICLSNFLRKSFP